MPYVIPQVQVFQDFEIAAQSAANPLNAYIVGPQARLIRFAVEDERADGSLGFYDDAVATEHLYPTRDVGSLVDTDYASVWVRDALLEYYNGGTVPGAVITGQGNRISSAGVVFAAGGGGVQSTQLLDRGARVGDIVRIVAGADTIWTYILGFVGDTVASIINPALSWSGNAIATAAEHTLTQTAGDAVDIAGGIISFSDYNGLLSGVVQDGYTLTVLSGNSTPGEVDNVRLRLISDSGLDDVAEFTPEHSNEVSVGVNGLLYFSDLPVYQVGQQFRLTVSQDFFPGVAASAGNFTGDQDTTYQLEVVQSGYLAEATDVASEENAALIRISTNNGTDGGTVAVTHLDTLYDVGNFGLQISFTAGSLLRGDNFIVRCVAATEGARSTIELGHNLPEDLSPDAAIDLQLFILNPALEINRERLESPPLTNYQLTADQVFLSAGMTAFHPDWTSNGQPAALPVRSDASQDYGEIFVEYRTWLADHCGQVSSISDVSELDEIAGPLDPDNPLKWALFKALSNSGGSTIHFSGICDATNYDEWSDALGLVLERSDVYGLVPLSTDGIVQSLFAAHVQAQSAPEQGRWRVTWLALSGVPELPIVHGGSNVPGNTEPTSTDGGLVFGSVSDNPQVTGTQYTRLVVPGANANFRTSGVRPRDIIRINFVSDGFGNETYEEFQVQQVINESELLLATPLDSPTVGPTRVEVWRNLNRTEEAREIARSAGAWGTRRVRAVWPDRLESDGTSQEGYHLCAALAALSGGVNPHQGLTNLEVQGFTDVDRTTVRFSRTELDMMALAGVWIVTQDNNTGQIFSRHGLTTGDSNDISQREEMLTRNVDSMSYRFRDQYAPFIGIANVTPSVLGQIRTETQSLVNVLKSELVTARLGPQLLEGEIIEVRPHAILRDRIVIVVRLVVPHPLNNLEVRLVV